MSQCGATKTNNKRLLSVLTLHHLENSRSQRILWLLEELGVDYEVRRYDRDQSTGLIR